MASARASLCFTIVSTHAPIDRTHPSSMSQCTTARTSDTAQAAGKGMDPVRPAVGMSGASSSPLLSARRRRPHPQQQRAPSSTGGGGGGGIMGLGRKVLLGLCIGTATLSSPSSSSSPTPTTTAAAAFLLPASSGGKQQQQQQRPRAGAGWRHGALDGGGSTLSSPCSPLPLPPCVHCSSTMLGATASSSGRAPSEEGSSSLEGSDGRGGFGRRKEAIRVRSVDQLLDLTEAQGAKLRDLDVRGESTALLMAREVLHPVAEIIHRRVKEGSKPGQRSDGLKIGLALEGGGMRGCVGAGMLAALNHLGLRDAFDVIYGSSAGSLMGAYFLSGQTPLEGPGIYYDVLSQAGASFIDRSHLLRSIGLGALDLRKETWAAMVKREPGPPVLNLDFLLRTVVQNVIPLDWPKFWERQQLQPLKVVVSALLSKESVALSSEAGNFHSLEELAQCMRASMLLPGIAGPLVRINEDRTGESLQSTFWREKRGGKEGRNKSFSKGSEPLCDALLFEPIPYRSALREECSHVLVLRTRPDGVSVTGKMGMIEKMMYRRFFSRKNELPGIAQWMVEQRHKRLYAEDVLRLNAEAVEPGSTGGPPLMCLALSEDMPEIHRLEMRREVLLQGVRNGFAVAYDLMVPDPTMRGKGAEVAKEVFRVAEESPPPPLPEGASG